MKLPSSLGLRLLAATLLALPGARSADQAPAVGRDVAEVFARAAKGESLSFVALGGSITQAGKGWVGDWLEKQFPNSQVKVANAGIAGTNSAFGMFRLEQDVITQQPDLVFVEYCVNDGNSTDESAIRCMESIVVRLKSLPRPPAIVILEAAQKGGVNLQRHRQVATHYGLAEVDLQKAVDEHLKKENQPWETLFGDAVHPNKVGHDLYARVIEARLAEFLPGKDAAANTAASAPLPPPLSKAPLLLDGTLINLGMLENAPGWKREDSIPFWWDRLFHGLLSTEKVGATLQLTVRGSSLGLFYPLRPEYGKMLVSVDGGFPVELNASFREGFTMAPLGDDLEEKEHIVTILSVGGIRGTEPVKLGYLLAAGGVRTATGRAAQGPYSPEVLASLSYKPILSGAWQWAGPYGKPEPSTVDGLPFMKEKFAPESAGKDQVTWQAFPEKDVEWLNFQKLFEQPAVIYAKTEVSSDKDEAILLGLAADYFCEVWVNGESKALLDGPHGSPQTKRFYPARLRKGSNTILIKAGSGSQGFGFSIALVHSPHLQTDKRLMP